MNTNKKIFFETVWKFKRSTICTIHDFLAYVSEWKSSINLQPQEFKNAQKSAMFLSLQTYES